MRYPEQLNTSKGLANTLQYLIRTDLSGRFQKAIKNSFSPYNLV